MASGIGRVLHDARRGVGVTLEQAAADTHLRDTYLAALERDDIDALGLDPAYVRGTLRTYAAYLGLDSEALVERYRAGSMQMSASVARRSGAQPGSRGVANVVVRVVSVVAVAVVAFLLGQALARVVLPSLLGMPDRSDVRGASEAAPRVTQGAAPSDVGDAGDEVVADAPAVRLRLAFTDRTWARVVADGRTELEGVYDAGAVERIRADERIVVRIGVAGAARFTFNGDRYGRMARNRTGPVDVRCDIAGGCRVVE